MYTIKYSKRLVWRPCHCSLKFRPNWLEWLQTYLNRIITSHLLIIISYHLKLPYVTSGCSCVSSWVMQLLCRLGCFANSMDVLILVKVSDSCPGRVRTSRQQANSGAPRIGIFEWCLSKSLCVWNIWAMRDALVAKQNTLWNMLACGAWLLFEHKGWYSSMLGRSAPQPGWHA